MKTCRECGKTGDDVFAGLCRECLSKKVRLREVKKPEEKPTGGGIIEPSTLEQEKRRRPRYPLTPLDRIQDFISERRRL